MSYDYATVWVSSGQSDQIERRHRTAAAARAWARHCNAAFRRAHPASGGVSYLCGYEAHALDEQGRIGEWIDGED